MMILVTRILLRSVIGASAFVLLAAHSSAVEFRYRTTGDDLYRVGATPSAHIVYAGTQQLSIRKIGSHVWFTAEADCDRTDSGVTTEEKAGFVQELLADGSFADRTDDDPDFLTILNQPFAIRLDAATVRDLQELHAPVPFTAASPVGGGDLQGALRRGIPGVIAGHPVVGVTFRADGTINGPLPGRVAAVISGSIHLDGTAYYDTRRALLLVLDARLTIEGVLSGTHLAAVPVRIVYARTIRILS